MVASWADVTGRGVISSAGLDVETFDRSILTGRDCIGPLAPEIRAGLRFGMGSPVAGFEPATHFDAKTISTLDTFSQFATVAARQAWQESGVADTDTPGERIGVIVGTANAGINILQEGWHRILREDRKPVPMTIPMTMGSAPASRIAREIGAKGPVFGVTSACASAAHAIHLGLMMIRSGLADVMMVGGTDHCYISGYLSAWEVLRVVSPDTCRPFSKNRSGMIIGEGAGMVVIEAAGRAAARGAIVRGHLLGAGMTSDADNLTTPNGAGMSGSILGALTDAKIAPSDVAYINAHGTGTAINDRLEAGAIRTAFGSHADKLAVSSTKSAVGHAMGASGGLELLATLAALQHQIAPPTLHYAEPDPLCDLDVVPEGPRPLAIDCALSNSFAFGGLNVTLAVGRAGLR